MQRSFGRTIVSSIAFTACLGLVLMFVPGAAQAQYQLTNLSSNQVGQAKHIDPLLVNGWGLVYGPGGPWWVSDENSGWSTLYDGAGRTVQQLKVLIPTAGENGPGSPTGIVFNGSSEFQVQGWSAIFLFAALDGTISGWAPQSNFNQALIGVNNSSKGSVYTGLAITSKASKNRLYAADVANNRVDMFDGNFNSLGSFTDAKLPEVCAVRDPGPEWPGLCGVCQRDGGQWRVCGCVHRGRGVCEYAHPGRAAEPAVGDRGLAAEFWAVEQCAVGLEQQ